MVVRHRLDRGGDRQLNRALHTIIVSRRKHQASTIAGLWELGFHPEVFKRRARRESKRRRYRPQEGHA
jgi:transposase